MSNFWLQDSRTAFLDVARGFGICFDMIYSMIHMASGENTGRAKCLAYLAPYSKGNLILLQPEFALEWPIETSACERPFRDCVPYAYKCK